jgi:hypothetical protein
MTMGMEKEMTNTPEAQEDGGLVDRPYSLDDEAEQTAEELREAMYVAFEQHGDYELADHAAQILLEQRGVIAALQARVRELEAALEPAEKAITDAEEELQLIRMKDTRTIYDTLLRHLTIPLALQKIRAARRTLSAGGKDHG